MILFHGSTEIVEKPVFGYGRADNDYGIGFYCTEDRLLASEWACLSSRGGFVNTYEIDLNKLKVLDLSEMNVVSWIALLINNRSVRYSSPIEKKSADYLMTHFLPDTSSFDVICGYRADDSYFSYARAFLSNTISIQQLCESLRLGDLGKQICLKSKKSFSAIRFKSYEPVDGEVFYPKRVERDTKARRAYYKLLEKDIMDGVFVRDIVREEMKADDLRI